jgi:hypothetical protein
VDVGSLKDIDPHPKNIKELSKLLASQIESTLVKKLEKMNNN